MSASTTHRWILVVGVVLAFLCPLSAPAGAVTLPDGLRPADAPGRPAPGLQFFRLTPASPDTTYRLLVLRVRFPEDNILAGGDVDAKLNGTLLPSVRRLFADGTGGRLQVVATLAPEITATHPRAWYTVTESGFQHFGLSQAAYPRNAQGLMEEMTAQLVDQVDFKLFDNTLDGVTDGLLLLHSGPATGEASPDPLPPDALLSHSFTLPEPVERGSAQVFPYAVASARDGFGVWAHELGHLLGLPDLYVANPFPLCPREGVGEWSLMATGANREGGDDPVGLDPFSRQLLGMEPLVPGPLVNLTGGRFLRVPVPGNPEGERYFLVEQRLGTNGPAGSLPGMVVYWVDEGAVDNRDCTRPLVEVRAVVVADIAILDDDTNPSLLDGEGRPTGWRFIISNGGGGQVEVSRPGELPLRIERVRVLAPVPGNPDRQPLEISVRNIDFRAVEALLELMPTNPADLCLDTSVSPWQRTIPPGGVVVDTSWALVACAGPGPVPTLCDSVSLTLSTPSGPETVRDTLVLCGGEAGLTGSPGNGLAEFTSASLNPARSDPWVFSGSSWTATDWDAFAHAQLQTPWFIVPEDGVAVLQHLWNFQALAVDFAFDGAVVTLQLQEEPAVALQPSLGWGYHAERGTGNPLGGREVLSGSGDRVHVLDLGSYAGRVARIGLEVAGDFQAGGGYWEVGDFSIRSRSPHRFLIERDADGSTTVSPVTPFTAPVNLQAYKGFPAVTPTALGPSWLWQGEAALPLHAANVVERVDLVWRDADDQWGSTEDLVRPGSTPPSAFSLHPAPNPWPAGTTVSWEVVHPPGARFGTYRFAAFSTAGRRVWSRDVEVATIGSRTVVWNGVGDDGRRLASGVYFLRVDRPDGVMESRQLVRIP